jgi:hypothetical protein
MRVLSPVTSSSCCERNLSTYGNLYSLKKSRLEQSRAETMVYVHNNLHLIYRQREEWVKGKTKMWDVFLDDMGLDQGCWEWGVGSKRVEFQKFPGARMFQECFLYNT